MIYIRGELILVKFSIYKLFIFLRLYLPRVANAEK